MNEIIAGPTNENNKIQLLCFIRDSLTPITYTNNLGEVTKVIPTPSDDLPDWAIDLVSLEDMDKLDNGTLGFKIAEFLKDFNMSDAEILLRAQVVYAATKQIFLAQYNQKYHKFYGKIFSI